MDDLEGLNCVVWSWTHGTLNLEIQIDLAKCVSRASALYNFAFCHDVFVETDKLECHFVVLQRSHHATKLRLAPGSLISPRFILSKGQIKQRDAKTLSPIDWLHLLCCPVLCFYSSVFYSPGFYDCRQVINIFSARLEYETVGEERSFIYISIKKKHADKQLCIWLLPHNFFLHQAVLSKLFWVLICLENAMGKNKIMRKPNPSRRFSLSLRINHTKKKKGKKRGTNLRLQTQYMTVPWKQVTRQFKVYF